MRVLLVEPDYQLARLYYEALVLAGHEVVPAASAQAAISAADRARPDVVILELQLTQHSGIEFLYEFRSYAEWQQIPVIVQTFVPAGEFAGQWKLLSGHLGVADYLYKPLTPLQRLLAAVAEHAPDHAPAAPRAA